MLKVNGPKKIQVKKNDCENHGTKIPSKYLLNEIEADLLIFV